MNKQKKRITLTIIFATILFGLMALFSGCKKEKGPSCGVCDYIEHYSHNDSTFTITGTKWCDEAYEGADSEYHVHNDTMSGVPTTVEYYYNCRK